jgi:O-antigen ligase
MLCLLAPGVETYPKQMPRIRNDEPQSSFGPISGRRKVGWWETENAGSSEWPKRARVDGFERPHSTLPEPQVESSPEPKRTAMAFRDERWLVRRGHMVSFFGLFLFTAVLYYRPYELFPSLSSFSSIAFYLAAATLVVFLPSQLMVEGNLTARPSEVNLLLLLAVTALLSIPLAINPLEAWETFNDTFLKAVVMFIVMINVVRTTGRLRLMFLLSLSVGCYLSIAALNDYRSGNLTIEGYRIEGAIGGMFANPNDMALYLVTMIPLAVALCFAARHVAARLFYACVTLLMVGGMTVTYSRGGFLGLIAAALVLAWKLGRRNRLLIISFAVVVGILFIVFAPGGYGTRLLSIFIPGLDAVGSSSARKELLLRSIFVAARHPLFGIGMGNFHIVSIGEHVSHNAYTQVAAELGMTALALYTMFIVRPLRQLSGLESASVEGDRTSRATYYLSVGLQASIAAYMVSSFFASVAYQWYIYYLVGYAVCLRRIAAAAPATDAGLTMASSSVPQQQEILINAS